MKKFYSVKLFYHKRFDLELFQSKNVDSPPHDYLVPVQLITNARTVFLGMF